jgi:aspartate racemase
MEGYHRVKMGMKAARKTKLKTIGVLGGMGPEATAYFFGLVTRNTRVSRDQDHIPVVVCSLPQVPDRTEAILRGGPSPLPFLLRGVEALRRAGADFAVMPCITAHYFYPALAARSPLPVVNLLDETVSEVRGRHPGIKRIGLIATAGTVRSRVFHDAFEAAGIEVLVPDARAQKRIMSAIYGRRGIKAGATAGTPRNAILDVAAGLVRRGAGGIVAGCTEIPLVLGDEDLPVPLIEPMRIGALACIRRAGGEARRSVSRKTRPRPGGAGRRVRPAA